MLFIANDHAGIGLKKIILEHCESKNIAINDLGVDAENSVDYPDIADMLCEKILQNSQNLGILICGSGIGMSIAANRYNGIRAALCINSYMAHFARAHNDCNVLCLGERVIGSGLAIEIFDTFLAGSFERGRHAKRVDKLYKITQN